MDDQHESKDTTDVSISKTSVHGSVAKDVEGPTDPAEPSSEQDTSGGMGRHLGVFSCTMIIVGRIIGTGIFSTPSSILSSVGSVGASIMLWVLGFVLSFCGLFIWLEYGTMFPRSGGEKVYLEVVYKKPRFLATIIFATNAILLGYMSESASCLVFASNILVAAGHQPDLWVVRGIAVSVISFVVILHGLTPKLGVLLMNGLSVFKIVVLLFIVITGWVVLAGKTHIEDPHLNFRNAFAGSSHSGNDYATATFKVIYAYSGWTGINYVLNEVKNPIRTLKIAGPLGLGICAVLYLLANVSYFAAATKDEIKHSGVTVSSLFFLKVFGTKAQKAVSVMVALSALGNVITSAYTASRVNQELAKEGIPLPFGNIFWASNWPTGKSPLPGLVLHFTPAVILILVLPQAVAFPFILDVRGYPQQIIYLSIVGGIFWLRWKHPERNRPFKVWWPLALFFLIASVFLTVAPFIRPANKVGDTPPLPYYLYPLVGIAVLFLGVLYWAMWRIILPWIFNYRLVPSKTILEDGTVVNVFSRENLKFD